MKKWLYILLLFLPALALAKTEINFPGDTNTPPFRTSVPFPVKVGGLGADGALWVIGKCPVVSTCVEPDGTIVKCLIGTTDCGGGSGGSSNFADLTNYPPACPDGSFVNQIGITNVCRTPHFPTSTPTISPTLTATPMPTSTKTPTPTFTGTPVPGAIEQIGDCLGPVCFTGSNDGSQFALTDTNSLFRATFQVDPGSITSDRIYNPPDRSGTIIVAAKLPCKNVSGQLECPTPTITATPSNTPTSTPTKTSTATLTITVTVTPTISATPTATRTPTATVTPAFFVAPPATGTTTDLLNIQAQIDAATVKTRACLSGGGICNIPQFSCSGGTQSGQACDSGEVKFPSNSGKYLINDAILGYEGLTFSGSSKSGTIIQSDTSGTGFSMFRTATPNTCVGGVGDLTTCDDPLDGGTRGPNCVCYADADCQASTALATACTSGGGVCNSINTCVGGSQAGQLCGACTIGKGIHNITIRDIRFVIRKDNMVGLDMAFVSEPLLDNIQIQYDKFSGSPYLGTVGMRFGDGTTNSTITGYSANVLASHISTMDIGIQILPRANDLRIIGNVIGNGCNRGVIVVKDVVGAKIDATHISENLFQSTVLGQGPEIEDHGIQTHITNNRFESSNLKINLTSDSQNAWVVGNTFIGTGQDLLNQVALPINQPVIFGNDFEDTNTTINSLGPIAFDKFCLEGSTTQDGTELCITSSNPSVDKTVNIPEPIGTLTQFCLSDGSGCPVSTITVTPTPTKTVTAIPTVTPTPTPTVTVPLSSPAGGGLEYYRASSYFPSLFYLAGQIDSGTLTSITATNQVLYLVPFTTTSTKQIDSISFYVTTGIASSQCRVGYYDNLDPLAPHTALFDSGLLAAATTGLKTAAISPTQTLTAGSLYWFALLCSGGATGPNVRGIQAASLWPIFGVNMTASSAFNQLNRVATGTFIVDPGGAVAGGSAPAIAATFQ